LFKRKDRYEEMTVALGELQDWVGQKPDYCLQMSNIFKSKCHKYLIESSPYLKNSYNPEVNLLYGVLILQGMRCSYNDQLLEQDQIYQAQLFSIIRRILSTALMTSPLKIQDLEAMLYMSIYNAARKPKQPIFDSWLLTGYAIKLFLVSFDLEDDHDASGYTYEIWNNLCACHLEYALSSGKPILIPGNCLDRCSNIRKYRQPATDDVILAEISLLGRMDGQATEATLEQWKTSNYHYFRQNHNSNTDEISFIELVYSYCFVITTSDHQKAIEFSASIIRGFLMKTAEDIDSMPNFPLIVLIYACLTLCKLINYSTTMQQKSETLNLIAKIYWYLYHIAGEQPKVILHSIAHIIRDLLEKTMASPTPNSSSVPLLPRQPTSVTTATTSNVSPIDAMPVNMNDISYTLPPSDQQLKQPPMAPQQLDMSQYSSFKEFFDGVFSYVGSTGINAR
jgi:hypothetical protein